MQGHYPAVAVQKKAPLPNGNGANPTYPKNTLLLFYYK